MGNLADVSTFGRDNNDSQSCFGVEFDPQMITEGEDIGNNLLQRLEVFEKSEQSLNSFHGTRNGL